ncbi:MAG: glycosyltransferase family 2 protein [Rhodobacteraceae bacterium]|nr:glycosyltransferase family 2 protein [Paracoccaceae bacterium]
MNDLSNAKGLTLCGLLRNEAYFLDAFLDHYRRLGVERFIFVDDRSDDGTREMLFEQADVMVLESPDRFATVIEGNGRTPLADMRSNIIWRNIPMSRFCYDTWAVMVDLDEFIALPPGAVLQDVAALADKDQARSVLGVMLGVYPPDTSALKAPGPFVVDDAWFFDRRQHLEVQANGSATVNYAGARVRLFVDHGVRKLTKAQQLRRLFEPSWLPVGNWNHKQVLLKWGQNQLFLNSHLTTEAANPGMLLPIRHYKFNADLFRRTQTALKDRTYAGNSIEYEAIARLLDRLDRTNTRFTFRHSMSAENFDAFADSRNAVLDF